MSLEHCQYSECNKPFYKKTHNQKYHSDECCRLATNAKIMERYYEQKSIREGKPRTCSRIGCKTKLSRYNYEDVCSIHSGYKEMSPEDLYELIL